MITKSIFIDMLLYTIIVRRDFRRDRKVGEQEKSGGLSSFK